MESTFKENDYKPHLNAIKTICRCCLSTDRRMAKIGTFRDYFVDLADIIVSDSDGLPQWICYECKAILVKTVKFKRKVLRAHTVLYDYHNRCTPFPIDGHDPELSKYMSPLLTQSSTLVFDTSRSKMGYYKVLAHDRQFVLSKLDHLIEDNTLDDSHYVKKEMSEVDEDLPLLEFDEKIFNESEAVPEKKGKAKAKIKLKKKVNVQQTDIVSTALDYKKPKRMLRKPVGIDERTEQFAQRETVTHTRRYECLQCGQRMLDRMAIVNHYRSQHEGVLSVFTCHICGKVSEDDATHRGHMRIHHSDTCVKCDDCGKSFATKDSLVEHLLIHQEIKNFECEKREKKFRTRNQIRRRMVKHSDAKDFYCVQCDARFKSEHTLRQHLKKTSKHKDIKSLKYECSTCSKRFETESSLAHHARVQHEGVREHRCVQCGAALASRASLAKHARSVHAAHRPPPAHVCHTCGKMFRAKSTLVNHVRTHTGEKPYECDTCGRSFAQRTAMRTHVKLVHLKIHRSAKMKSKPLPESLHIAGEIKEKSPLGPTDGP